MYHLYNYLQLRRRSTNVHISLILWRFCALSPSLRFLTSFKKYFFLNNILLCNTPNKMAKTFQKADFLFSISFLDFYHAFIPLSTNFSRNVFKKCKILKFILRSTSKFSFMEYSSGTEFNKRHRKDNRKQINWNRIPFNESS